MQRDLSFEEKINTKNFNYHWIINNELVGLPEGLYYPELRLEHIETGSSELAVSDQQQNSVVRAIEGFQPFIDPNTGFCCCFASSIAKIIYFLIL